MKKTTIILTTVLLLFFLLLGISSKNQQKEDVKGVEMPMQKIENITPTKANDMMQSEDLIILDVRSSDEFAQERIPNAQNKSTYEDLDREKTYIIYCLSGARSASALKKMQSLDFQEVYNIEGGINGWKDAGYPISQ